VPFFQHCPGGHHCWIESGDFGGFFAAVSIPGTYQVIIAGLAVRAQTAGYSPPQHLGWAHAGGKLHVAFPDMRNFDAAIGENGHILPSTQFAVNSDGLFVKNTEMLVNAAPVFCVALDDGINFIFIFSKCINQGIPARRRLP